MNIDFEKNGFTFVHDQTLCDMLDIDSLNWSNKGTVDLQIEENNPDIETRKERIQNYIIEKYLLKHYSKATISYVEITKGIDEEYTGVWHHDFTEGDTTVNIGVLLYFDTLDKDTGGYLQIKESNAKSYKNYYPVAGDVLFLNQTPKFLHRVESLKYPLLRRVAIFNFWVDK